MNRVILISLTFLFCLESFGQIGMTLRRDADEIPAITDPRDISDLALWLDAQDVDGNFDGGTGDPSADSAVDSIFDKSGNDNHAYQSTGSYQPLYRTAGINSTYASLDFDGSNDYMALSSAVSASASDYTVFWVISADALNSADWVYLLDAETGRFIMSHNVVTSNNIGHYDGAWKDFGTTATTGNQYITYRFENGVGAEGYRAGSSIGTSTYTQRAMGGAIVIANRFTGSCPGCDFNGDIGEVIIYTRALTSSEIGQVHDYIVSKWGF